MREPDTIFIMIGRSFLHLLFERGFQASVSFQLLMGLLERAKLSAFVSHIHLYVECLRVYLNDNSIWTTADLAILDIALVGPGIRINIDFGYLSAISALIVC